MQYVYRYLLNHKPQTHASDTRIDRIADMHWLNDSQREYVGFATGMEYNEDKTIKEMWGLE